MTNEQDLPPLSRREFLKTGLAAGASLVVASRRDTKPAAASTEQQATAPPDGDPLYLDYTRPVAERVDDLVGRMSLEEKIAQMGSNAPAIDRLGIAQYNWWNEALHGVARAGVATVFPQAIGLAGTWNDDLILQMARVISDEGRAKHHEAARNGVRDLYTGLTFWSPNINIFRDPR
ncbi:MAG: twin-arginine translocation signal domain-containing protein, partial [Anaerolineae bacterium]|nr:twin-arginine translocation signal domain-containing protein [Anaerolineae bacterium]